MINALELLTTEIEIDPFGAGQRFLESIHQEIDTTPIHEVRARFIASNQQDAVSNIFLGILTRNDPYEDEHRHQEKSALVEALGCFRVST